MEADFLGPREEEEGIILKKKKDFFSGGGAGEGGMRLAPCSLASSGWIWW